jgi:hypothetical protein
MKTETLQFEFIGEKFTEFLDILKELTKMGDTIKILLDENDMFVYTALGSKQILLGMKSFTLKTADFIKTKEPIIGTLDIVITSAKKFVKSISHFNIESKINAKLTYRMYGDKPEVKTFQLTNSRLRLHAEIGDQGEIRAITENQLNKILSPNRLIWSFIITDDNFDDILKLAKINTDESRKIIELSCKDSEVKIIEPGIWDYHVDTVITPDARLFLNKDHLKHINRTGKDINFHIYPTSILIEGENNKLVLSFEQDFAS